MKKITAMFLLFSFLAFSGNIYAEKKGAEVTIHKKDGQYERGELIAVRKNSLLLKDHYSGADSTIEIANIGVIRIEKKSKTLTGFLLGGLLGAGVGAFSYEKPETEGEAAVAFLFGYTQVSLMVVGAMFFGLVGLVIGALAGKDQVIQIEGKSKEKIEEILEKLRKEARIRYYQ